MRLLLIAWSVLLITSASTWGQGISTAQIDGTVVDTSGLVVPGAQVKVTQRSTGLVRSVASGADGGYLLTNLPVGPYQLEVTRDGFATYVQAGIVLQVGSNPTINVSLRVGTVSEQVQVEANGDLVETRNAGVGQVIDSQRVLELPLNGRQAIELVYLSGVATTATGTAATQPGGSGVNSGVRNYPTTVIAVAGGLVNGTEFVLDGGTHNDPYSNLNLPLPFPDALQEFKVETSALPAQYGHHSSAVVNAVTRSGTNAFHGDAFEFIRNSAVNARNAFSLTSDGLKRNQLGGTLGGPIRRNKLFFFIGEQTTLQRIAPSDLTAFVPSAQMLTGDFTAIAGAQCNSSGRQISLPAPFVNNAISPALLSPPALNIVSLPAFPKTQNPCGQVFYSRKESSNEYNALARIDYQISDKQSLFGRYLVSHLDQPTDADPKNLLSALQGDLHFQVPSFVMGDTYLLGSGTVNSFHVTANRTNLPKSPVPSFDASQVGINVYVGEPNLLLLSVANAFNVGRNTSNRSKFNTFGYQFSDDLDLVRGAHQIGIGATWIHSIYNSNSGLSSIGTLTFGSSVTGLGLADFMIGKAASFTQGSVSLTYFRYNYSGLYAQDTWKVTPRFTISYGLRWEPYFPPYAKQNWVSYFDPALFAAGLHTSQYTNAPAGLIYPGDAGYPGSGVAFSRWNILRPRLGLAWDPKGDGRMSIRAAYGVFSDFTSLDTYNFYATEPPFGNSASATFPSNLANPWQSTPGGNPFPLPAVSKSSLYVLNGTYENVPLHFKPPVAHQWNLTIQRQLGTNWLVQANYIGNGYRHLPGSDQDDPGIYIPGSCVINGVTTNPCSTIANVNFRRVLYLQNPAQGQYFASIRQYVDGGTGSYNALVLSAQHRSAKGYSINAVYTWSHCIADLTVVENGDSTYMIPGDRAADRSNCPGSDRRHALNLSGVYEIPRFSNSTLRKVASDWQISAIVRLTTGPYIAVTTGLDQALTGQTSVERPNQILANPFVSNGGLARYLNPAAFFQPALGTYGSLGNYNVLSPGTITINMGLTRTVKLGEKYNLQFRVEMFNVPNHLNPGTPTGVSGSAGLSTPSVALNSPTFGSILSADDPRILQGALKFVF